MGLQDQDQTLICSVLKEKTFEEENFTFEPWW